MGAGPFVVLANGLGGSFSAWRHITRHLSARFRVVSFDYRGTHASAVPADRGAITMLDHVHDLEALLETLRIDRALFVGWSMGVQLIFELYRRHPEVFRGIAAVDGSAGRAFESVRDHPALRLVTALTLGALTHFGGAVGAVARFATHHRGFVPFLSRVGLAARELDAEIFADMAKSFATLDLALYGETLRLLDHHSAWDVLPSVRVPTVVMTGERDFMTPTAVAKRMVKLLPDSRFVLLPGCTHYAAAEKPDLINAALDDLIARLDPR
ncbi:MAG: alpha/beta hydrolase [Deltaproteobacteria bacterium]|nr:alpha/beta hydrolase [Deltaproteobacteria bacterium]